MKNTVGIAIGALSIACIALTGISPGGATKVDSSASPEGFVVVLKDDFNDAKLGLKGEWWINTFPCKSSVTERLPEGVLESKNRGYLSSTGQWKPGARAVGTLSVTGRFRLPNEGAKKGDIANIVVRSGGVARGQPPGAISHTVPCNIVADGIEFGVTRQPLGDYGCIMWLDLHIGPDKDITLAYKPFKASSDWYWFKVEDDGYNVRVWCNLTGDFSGNPDLKATTDHSFKINHVSFYGRLYEYDLDHVTYFDDITVSYGQIKSEHK